MTVTKQTRNRPAVLFFFKQKTAYEMRISDWSSDVCSSDLHAVIGDHPARCDEFLAQPEGRRHADRLDRGIDALAFREIANQTHDGITRAVERVRGAEPARDSKAVVVEIDHDDASRRVELRGEQGRKPDRTSTSDRHAAPRCDLPVENPRFIAGRQDRNSVV